MSALQMPVYWIFLEKFQFLSVPFSPFLSDATHILYLKTNKEKGQGAKGGQKHQLKGQVVIFLSCAKNPTKHNTKKPKQNPKQTPHPNKQ